MLISFQFSVHGFQKHWISGFTHIQTGFVHKSQNTFVSMPKVIFLEEAEFSGSQVRPMNYENAHKNIFGLSVVLELKVENIKFWLS